jgi:hypothetical protein
MKYHKIEVGMVGRSSVLLEGDSPERHRGIWFYDPAIVGEVNVGDEVCFVVCGGAIGCGKVTEIGLKPTDFPKFCSGLNSAGFRWESVC